MNSRIRALALATVLGSSSAALAHDETTLELGPLPLELHGYATQGFVISDHNNYFTTESNKGSLHLTELALNAASQVTDRLRVVLQVASVMNDTAPGPRLLLDFGFADYRFCDALGIRAGRFRMLGNLYSEVWDTDIARLPIFLPSGIYDAQGRQLFLSSQGVQAYGSVRSADAGSLDYVASVGALSPLTLAGTTTDVDLVTSARLIYNTPLDGLRFGGAGWYANGHLDTQLDPVVTAGVIQAGLAPQTFDGHLRSTMSHLWRWSAFAELSRSGFTLAAEYMRMSYEVRPDDAIAAALFPVMSSTIESFYLLGSYRFTDHFTAGGYASFQFPDVRRRSASDPALHTFDYAATLRFDVNAYLALKTELHHIDGTSQLQSELNAGAVSSSGWLFALRLSAAF